MKSNTVNRCLWKTSTGVMLCKDEYSAPPPNSVLIYKFIGQVTNKDVCIGGITNPSYHESVGVVPNIGDIVVDDKRNHVLIIRQK